MRVRRKLIKVSSKKKKSNLNDTRFYCSCVALGLALSLLLQSNNYFGTHQSFMVKYIRNLKTASGKVKRAQDHFLPLNQSCTLEQREIIQYQLPPEHCEIHKTRPWTNRCSFSYATRCPHSTWLEHLYQQPSSSQQSRKPTAVYVGCNKGMDAVNTLRMISSNPQFDKEQWKQTLFGNQTDQIQPGHCGQEHEQQFDLSSFHLPPKADAVVHCIEAMPITARRLTESAQDLKWQQHLKVSNVALSSVDGTAIFPDRSDKIGIEQQGLADCKQDKPVSEQPNCKEIPMYRLDTFIKQIVDDGDSINKNNRIDFLSIDVEGFDREVLMGANMTLKRIGYLEFEYNWRGLWPKAKLSDTVGYLHDHGFVCYWAGAFGNVWRMSGDCFLDHYDIHHWSNVACVNARDPQSIPIHRTMENMFQQTLARGKEIRYAEEKTANTNGRNASSVRRSI